MESDDNSLSCADTDDECDNLSDTDTDYYSDEEGNDVGAYWLSSRVLRQRSGVV